MDQLPDEILLHIFDYLSPRILWLVISKVCRRWEEVASYRVVRLWSASYASNLHAGMRGMYAPKRIIALPDLMPLTALLTPFAPNLRELVLCDEARLAPRDYHFIQSHRALRHLDVFAVNNLNQFTIPPSGITSLIVNNTCGRGYLKHLAVSLKIEEFHMYGASNFYDLREMTTFLKVQALNFTHVTLRCSELGEERLLILGTCRNLVQLQLYTCWLMTALAFQAVASLPKLRVLHITGSRMVRLSQMSGSLEQLSPSILELNLSASWFTNEHVSVLRRSAPGLRRLELWRCNLTAVGLLEAAEHLTALTELDTDVPLTWVQVEQMQRYPALRDLRCCFTEPVVVRGERGVRGGRGAVRGAGVWWARRAGRAAGGRLRDCGEGPSAAAYYHGDSRPERLEQLEQLAAQ